MSAVCSASPSIRTIARTASSILPIRCRCAGRELDRRLWWSHTNVVAEFQVSKADPNKADPTSERIVSQIDWPQFNHNGHWIGFGPDNMLYVSTGDGGYANDWGIGHNVMTGNGQDLTSIHGKILRIDVNKPDGIAADNPFVGRSDAKPQIWAYGMRNPWRCSFDMGGDKALMCGDVQQNSWEEVRRHCQGQQHGLAPHGRRQVLRLPEARQPPARLVTRLA